MIFSKIALLSVLSLLAASPALAQSSGGSGAPPITTANHTRRETTKYFRDGKSLDIMPSRNSQRVESPNAKYAIINNTQRITTRNTQRVVTKNTQHVTTPNTQRVVTINPKYAGEATIPAEASNK